MIWTTEERRRLVWRWARCGAQRICRPLVTPMSIAVYVTGFLFVWLLMVLSLGLALKRCLAERGVDSGR